MVRSKAAVLISSYIGFRRSAAMLAGLSLAACSHQFRAQQAKPPAQRVITIIMANGRNGKTLIPDNFVIRFNHLNAIRNDTLTLNDDGTGKVRVPANATYVAVQGTYHKSIDLYVNCDAAMEKDINTLHWYSIDEIVSTGVTAPNDCAHGKYPIPAAPGELIFYVREIGWHDAHME